MAVAYDKLFRLVESQQMTSTGLMRKANISGNIISRLRHNEYVSLETIENICRVFQCRVDAVLDFKFSSEMNIAPSELFLRTANIQNLRYLGNKFNKFNLALSTNESVLF